jgi:NifB/MoaA-like Fe-S oxidoreductase
MEDLASMHPGVTSVAIVPGGLTRYREGLYPLTEYDADTAAAVIDLVEGYADQCRERFGTSLFWCSDEFYLLAGRPLPPDQYYESYNQLENGVGMLRLLEVEFHSALRMTDGTETASPFTIATGLDAAPMLDSLVRDAMAKCPGVRGQVIPVVNHFFGEKIVVSGLITGQDLISALKGRDLGRRLLLPDNMLRYHENVFLDDVTIQQVEEELGVPVTFVAQDGFQLCDAILGLDGQQKESRPAGDSEEYYRYNPSV